MFRRHDEHLRGPIGQWEFQRRHRTRLSSQAPHFSADRSVSTYLPNHKPALGALRFPSLPWEWTSGGALAAGADLLIHDGQYSTAEYPDHCGWGHSSLNQTLDFGTLTEVKQLVPFHHDPDHTDTDLDRLIAEAIEETKAGYQDTPGIEGTIFEL